MREISTVHGAACRSTGRANRTLVTFVILSPPQVLTSIKICGTLVLYLRQTKPESNLNIKIEVPNKIGEDATEVDVRSLIKTTELVGTLLETSLGDILTPVIVPALQAYVRDNIDSVQAKIDEIKQTAV